MTTKTLFLTGGSGFIGTALREQIEGEAWELRGVLRDPGNSNAGAGFVPGDLLDPDSYRDALRGAEVVVHLAAFTGKASPEEHRKINVEGTRKLIAACKQAGVTRFLHVSTIAAGYADKSHYAYAQSKAEAERLVRESGLDFTILRPTVVLGPDSPIWATLGKIAGLPVIPLPQGKVPVSLQPVLVDDVARAITLVLEEGRFDGDTLDVGGADPEQFDHFLQEVRRAITGKRAPVVTVPLGLPRAMLAMIEPIARPVLPVTAGQMALFANDSTVSPNWLMERLRPAMPSLSAMLAELTRDKQAATVPVAASPDSRETALLEAEADTFARYLSGRPPSSAALRHYLGANVAHGLASDAGLSAFDRRSLAMARRGPIAARCVDAFCGLLGRRSALRRKLVIMAAVLENQVPTNAIFEAPQSPGPVTSLLQLAGHGISFAGALVAGALFLGLARLTGAGRA